ncbi:hypothetical protein KSS87_007840 [Heliosperma pusillum]|nr:hypothetical protein KSS87_009623 [Heliosperma pusillum]KAH9617358.1 hypothetical protein KSS87_007840 [Heliosperma pusillum]
MENWCKGWVVNIFEEDRALFGQNYVREKKEAMTFSFDPLVNVQLTNYRYQPQVDVFNNQDLMNNIFNRVTLYHDKANMALVCRNWCQLFLIHPSAPLIQLAHGISLHINDVNGVRIIRRGRRIIYKRCKCFMTENMGAQVLLHSQQEQNHFQREHLTALDNTALAHVNELLHYLSLPSPDRDIAVAVSTELLTRATLSYMDLPLLLDL